jgi:diacylglycerol diphosphate phosphatase/phosphatidate phosphatase
VGRPRPDFFSRCQLPPDLTSNPVHGLTSWKVCTQTEHLQEGFRSFPSGHSSFGWSGMWYLELYLMASESFGDREVAEEAEAEDPWLWDSPRQAHVG